MNDRPIRVAISGAAGRIGYSLIFRIAAGGMFGPEQPVELCLLESPEARDRLRALELELTDCAFPLMWNVQVGTEPERVFHGADWIILLGGIAWTQDLTRAEIIRRNGSIYVEQGRAINAASPTARVLVVAAPSNVNAMIAKSVAQDVPEDHWFALNRLERMRATALLAQKAGVPVGRVTRLTVWGNHSELVYPDFHNAFIDDRPAPEVIHDAAWVREVFEPTVAHRTAEIRRLTGASPAATAAQAILGTIRSITIPTPFERRFGAAVVSDGSYGVPRGLIFGFPLVTPDGVHWQIVQGLYHDEYAQQRLAANVTELEYEVAIAGESYEIR